MDLLEAVDRQVAARLAVGAAFIRGHGAAFELAVALGLANGFAASTPDLGDLPEISPKDQPEVPEPIARVGAIVLLGQPMGRNPGTQEQLELMESGAGGGAEAMDLSSKGPLPGREVRCH